MSVRIITVCSWSATLFSNPLWLVLAISVAVGLVMVFVFRFVSNQKAIRRAKDRLKANLLAVRLFQDQLPVVLRAYGRILAGTGSYLRLAFTPLLTVFLPILFLMVQLDRYFGWEPAQPSQQFLVEAHVRTPQALEQAKLLLPSGLQQSAPAVHVPDENTVVWRVLAQHAGKYDIHVETADDAVAKEVVVSTGLARLSPVRLRGDLLERIFSSGEVAIPDSSPIQSISVNYPERNIRMAGIDWNWIVLFFVVSLAAGFFFKTVFGIQI